MKNITFVFEGILDLFFPRNCLGCKKEGGFLCENCEKQLDDLKPRAELSTEFLDKVFIACEYGNENLIGKLIKRVKYKFSQELSTKLAQVVARNLIDIVDWDCTLIPVPLSRRRMKWRGFNQAELIGKQVADIVNGKVVSLISQSKLRALRINTTLLQKIRDTKQQVECKSRDERLRNVRNAFQVSITADPPEKVILFDDVYTTGTTMNECAKTLKNSGVKKVFGLVIAKKTGSVV